MTCILGLLAFIIIIGLLRRAARIDTISRLYTTLSFFKDLVCPYEVIVSYYA